MFGDADCDCPCSDCEWILCTRFSARGRICAWKSMARSLSPRQWDRQKSRDHVPCLFGLLRYFYILRIFVCVFVWIIDLNMGNAIGRNLMRFHVARIMSLGLLCLIFWRCPSPPLPLPDPLSLALPSLALPSLTWSQCEHNMNTGLNRSGVLERLFRFLVTDGEMLFIGRNSRKSTS